MHQLDVRCIDGCSPMRLHLTTSDFKIKACIYGCSPMRLHQKTCDLGFIDTRDVVVAQCDFTVFSICM